MLKINTDLMAQAAAASIAVQDPSITLRKRGDIEIKGKGFMVRHT